MVVLKKRKKETLDLSITVLFNSVLRSVNWFFISIFIKSHHTPRFFLPASDLLKATSQYFQVFVLSNTSSHHDMGMKVNICFCKLI